MVRYIRDTTGRFAERPYYEPEELNRECESIMVGFLRSIYREVKFPVATEDLKKLIERDADDLDCYADLSEYGADVEGVTEFYPGRKPVVKIAAELTEDERRENRLRTTLTHEHGHVHFHAYLFTMNQAQGRLFQRARIDRIICKRNTMLDAPQSDWMEWQAGFACGAFLMPQGPLSAAIRRIGEELRLPAGKVSSSWLRTRRGMLKRSSTAKGRWLQLCSTPRTWLAS